VALPALKKAIELEPYYAMPHVMLGRIYDASGFTDDAIAAYQGFLARASRNDPQREFAERRVAALKTGATP
jgi:cytochrome c-type biogenesis protein CcmH/NrfG